jgi:hypothetical protein
MRGPALPRRNALLEWGYDPKPGYDALDGTDPREIMLISTLSELQRGQ